jgi:uncharacterized protein YrzB (UPF0473 family)
MSNNIVTICGKNGEERSFEVVMTLVLNANHKEYAILLPCDGPMQQDEDGEEAYVFRIDTNRKGEDQLTLVEDPKELDLVGQAYDELAAKIEAEEEAKK